MSNRATAEALCFYRVITVNQAREMIGLEPLLERGDRTGVWDIGAGEKDRAINPYLAQAVDCLFDANGVWIPPDDPSLVVND
jgi:hypothetical protein